MTVSAVSPKHSSFQNSDSVMRSRTIFSTSVFNEKKIFFFKTSLSCQGGGVVCVCVPGG